MNLKEGISNEIILEAGVPFDIIGTEDSIVLNDNLRDLLSANDISIPVKDEIYLVDDQSLLSDEERDVINMLENDTVGYVLLEDETDNKYFRITKWDEENNKYVDFDESIPADVMFDAQEYIKDAHNKIAALTVQIDKNMPAILKAEHPYQFVLNGSSPEETIQFVDFWNEAFFNRMK